MSTLGNKIRDYRKRSGKSQLELEMEIGASPGSISRIENGVVNPTKETIMEIADKLILNSVEVADLFDIPYDTPERILGLIADLKELIPLDDLLQFVVTEIARYYAFSWVAILKYKQESGDLVLWKLSHTNTALTALKSLGKHYSMLKINEKKAPDNAILESVVTGKSIQLPDNYMFAKGAIPGGIIRIMQKISGSYSGATVPIMKDSKKFGALYVSGQNKNDYHSEVLFLEEIARQIAELLIEQES